MPLHTGMLDELIWDTVCSGLPGSPLSSLEMTEEDADAWARVRERCRGGLGHAIQLFWVSRKADRRDADLMSNRELMKAETTENWECWAAHRREWFPSQWGGISDYGWINPRTPE